MNLFQINKVLRIEFIDSVFSPITLDNIRFNWLDDSIVLNQSEEFTLAIILQNTYLYNTYLSMSNIFNALQDLNLIYKIDSDSYGKNFRRSINKYPNLKAALNVHTQRGYKLDYEKIDTTNGRLSFIENICFSEISLIAITGVGGSGKTYVANYIYNFFNKRSNHGQDKKSVFSVKFNKSLDQTLLLLDICENYDEDTRLRMIRDYVKNNTELLIIDNVIFSSFTKDEVKFLKSLKNSSVRVIMTTRVLPDRMRFIKEYELPVISLEQSTDIFKYYYEYDVKNDQDNQTIVKISEKANGNILVLELLAKTARLFIRRGMSLAGYLSFLNKEGFNFPKNDLIDTDRWDDMTATEQIAKLYSINSDELDDLHKSAILEFALSDFIPLPSIDIEILLGISENIIDDLYIIGWLCYEDKQGFYMHDIVKSSVMLQFKPNKNTIPIFTKVNINKFDDYKTTNRQLTLAKISILYSKNKYANPSIMDQSRLYNRIGSIYEYDLNNPKEAIPLYREALKCCELAINSQQKGENTDNIFENGSSKADLLYDLSRALSTQGVLELEEAKTIIEQLIKNLIDLHNFAPKPKPEKKDWDNIGYNNFLKLCKEDNEKAIYELNNCNIQIDNSAVYFAYAGCYRLLAVYLKMLCKTIVFTNEYEYARAIHLSRISVLILETLNKYKFFRCDNLLLDSQEQLSYFLIRNNIFSFSQLSESINEAESILKEVVSQRRNTYENKKQITNSEKNEKGCVIPLSDKDGIRYAFIEGLYLSENSCYKYLSKYICSVKTYAECMFVKGDGYNALKLFKKSIELSIELNEAFEGNPYLHYIALSKYGIWCSLSKFFPESKDDIISSYNSLLDIYHELYELTEDTQYLQDLEFIETANQTNNYYIPVNNQKHFLFPSAYKERDIPHSPTKKQELEK